MSDAKHTPSGDASFRRSLFRHAASAIVLVAAVSAAFWAIGTLGAPDDGPLVVEESPTPSEEPEDTEPTGGEPTDGPADDGDDADGDDGTPTDGDGDDAGDAGDDGTDATDGGSDDDGIDDGAGPDPGTDDGDGDGDGGTTEPTPPPAIDPGTIRLQVLDGYKIDGGRAAGQVATLLSEAGYVIIARNDALSYEITTVLFNPGHEAAAEQVARDLGGAEVREQPGNLSRSVDLHVVVGADRA